MFSTVLWSLKMGSSKFVQPLSSEKFSKSEPVCVPESRTFSLQKISTENRRIELDDQKNVWQLSLSIEHKLL